MDAFEKTLTMTTIFQRLKRDSATWWSTTTTNTFTLKGYLVCQEEKNWAFLNLTTFAPLGPTFLIYG